MLVIPDDDAPAAAAESGHTRPDEPAGQKMSGIFGLFLLFFEVTGLNISVIVEYFCYHYI